MFRRRSAIFISIAAAAVAGCSHPASEKSTVAALDPGVLVGRSFNDVQLEFQHGIPLESYEVTQQVVGSDTRGDTTTEQDWTVVMQCSVHESGGAPEYYKVGIIPTNLYNGEIMQKAEAGNYADLLNDDAEVTGKLIQDCQ